jgi:glycosyltransferase involved in cell wall biosynthesis
LDSVYDIVDEIIIVDGGSSDKTVKIAQSYGKKIKIFHENNPKMFHINKQKAIEKAKGEWILQLDADEEVSEELKKEIKEIVLDSIPNFFHSTGSPSHLSARHPKSEKNWHLHQDVTAYWIPRKNFFLTRFLMKGGAYPDYTIRLYKNGTAKFPCKTVHENVDIKGKIGYLKNPILHYADPEFSRYLNRWKRYTSLDAEVLAKQKEKLSFISYFFIKPISWFFSSYIRHKGFMDGFPGFVFAFFSSIRFIPTYLKFQKIKNRRK